jgi:hypothetical protein
MTASDFGLGLPRSVGRSRRERVSALLGGWADGEPEMMLVQLSSRDGSGREALPRDDVSISRWSCSVRSPRTAEGWQRGKGRGGGGEREEEGGRVVGQVIGLNRGGRWGEEVRGGEEEEYAQL